jgi:hypothetical protein
MLNKSYSYLLPLFNEECKLDNDYFIMLNNVYTRYNDKLGNFVICYDDSDNDLFIQYIKELHDNELFIESFQENNKIYLVFNYPKAYEYDYNCYLKGKFSKFRNSAKLIIVDYILNIHKIATADKVRKVLYKEKELRERLEGQLGLKISTSLELSSIPDIKLETCYNLNK